MILEWNYITLNIWLWLYFIIYISVAETIFCSFLHDICLK